MRNGLAALLVTLALAGCGNSYDMAARDVTIEYPPDQAATAQASADAQCKTTGKPATLKGVETHGNVTSAVYACS